MNASLFFLFAAVVIIGGLLLVVIFITRKGPRPIDIEKYRTRWLGLEQQLKRDETSSYAMAVLNADKLLDQALQDRGFGGKTMGERMKSATAKWSNANNVWSAHKLRNRIAHEADVNVTFDGARQALASFKQALKELGAL